ncbi:MAG: hypothetical protein LBP69_08595 [Treponema sp.]|nr:hypothetical protein [Treponema sp.]
MNLPAASLRGVEFVAVQPTYAVSGISNASSSRALIPYTIKTYGVFSSSVHGGIFLLLAALSGCFSAPPAVEPAEPLDTGISSAPDRGGSVYIKNISGADLILFVNGLVHKRIPGNHPDVFRIHIAKERFAERYGVVLLSIYPAEPFGGNDYTLTAEIDSKSLVKMSIKDGDYVDFTVTGEQLRSALGY